MTDDRIPSLRDLGTYVFELGLEANLTELPTNDVPFNAQLALSIECDIIARALANCAWIQTGRQTNPNWSEFSLALQQRYRYLAERAVATIDPQIRLTAQAESAEETAEWMNGPYDPHNMPTYEDIANFAIASYESKLAGACVEMERAK